MTINNLFIFYLFINNIIILFFYIGIVNLPKKEYKKFYFRRYCEGKIKITRLQIIL